MKASIYLLFFALFLNACKAKVQQENTYPNFVYILADDLGWGDLSCYNNDSKIPTPNMDRIAHEGMRFTDAHSPSAVCTPTRYGILTGEYCWRTELKSGVLWGYSQPLIDIQKETVASLLNRNGYHTACIGKWHLGLPWPMKDPSRNTLSGIKENTIITEPLNQGGPVNLGFDYFYGIPASLDMDPYCYIENDKPVSYPTDSVAGMERSQEYDEGFWRAGPASPDFDFQQVLPHLTEKAANYIESQANTNSPFFLYFPLTAPHTPWVPTEQFRNKSNAGKYGDFVFMVDWVVGEILATLDQQNLAENTIVIITSDNGSHIDHIGEQYNHAANAHWRGQKADIHEGGHRVPFLARWPGKIKPNSVNQQIVCLTDLYRTCADLVGDTLRKNNQIARDSYSILPHLLNTQNQPQRASIVHHSLNGMFAIRKGDWKLIMGRGTGGFTQPRTLEPAPGEPEGQLYHLKEDPDESENVFHEYPEIVQELTNLLNTVKQEKRFGLQEKI